MSGGVVVGVVVLAGLVKQGAIADLAQLARPEQWLPVQVHELAMNLREWVPEGRVLGLESMVPLEAGLDAYAFTATGPFSWRTSLLLTPERRAEYGVVSPRGTHGLVAGAATGGRIGGILGTESGL